MSTQKRIRAELKKVASVLEPEFTNNRLQTLQILQSHAGRPFLAVRNITCGVGFHNVESKSRRSKTARFGEFKDVLKDLWMLRRTRFNGNFIIRTFALRAESIVTAIVEVFIAIEAGLLYKVKR